MELRVIKAESSVSLGDPTLAQDHALITAAERLASRAHSLKATAMEKNLIRLPMKIHADLSRRRIGR